VTTGVTAGAAAGVAAGGTAGITAGPAGRPAAGTLDLTLPWATMAGLSREPGHVSRLGPITPAEACQLAGLAVSSPATEWRIVVTSQAGQALAVTRIARRRSSPAPDGMPPRGRITPRTADGAGAGAGAGNSLGWQNASGAEKEKTLSATGRPALVGRVTLTVPENVLAGSDRLTSSGGGILSQALRAAAQATARAAVQRAADEAAGGCAHAAASLAYRPPPRLKEYVTVRDLTCRFPSCRQPAWRGDLDHTRPYERGGLTCSCNLGGLCRRHHILKQHPGWQLRQPEPGSFDWTTPTGRRYEADREVHPV
jgi:hypothetical protein